MTQDDITVTLAIDKWAEPQLMIIKRGYPFKAVPAKLKQYLSAVADDYPKTAEIISKVLLLAQDKDIKDPSILEQILPRS